MLNVKMELLKIVLLFLCCGECAASEYPGKMFILFRTELISYHKMDCSRPIFFSKQRVLVPMSTFGLEFCLNTWNFLDLKVTQFPIKFCDNFKSRSLKH